MKKIFKKKGQKFILKAKKTFHYKQYLKIRILKGGSLKHAIAEKSSKNIEKQNSYPLKTTFSLLTGVLCQGRCMYKLPFHLKLKKDPIGKLINKY